MNAKKKFILFSALYAVLTLTDLGLTYIGTPDLSREANPWVRHYGFGWSFLIVNSIFWIAVYALVAYCVFIRFKRSFIPCENFKQYLSMLSYNRPDKFIWIWYKFPSNKLFWIYACYYIGLFVYLVLNPVFRIIDITEWIGVITNSFTPLYITYNRILITWPFNLPGLLKVAAIPGVIYAAAFFLWLYYEYRNNKGLTDSNTYGNVAVEKDMK